MVLPTSRRLRLRDPPEGTIDRDLRWAVPASHRTQTPAGLQPTHDDRLLSAALVAELDRLMRAGEVTLRPAQSAVIAAADSIAGAVYWPSRSATKT